MEIRHSYLETSRESFERELKQERWEKRKNTLQCWAAGGLFFAVFEVMLILWFDCRI